MTNDGIRVHLFGGLTVYPTDGVPITRFPTQKTAALLALLALSPGRRYPREVIIDRLWPDATLENGRRSLRVALTALRRILEPTGTPPDSVLIASRDTVSLRAEAVSTDVADFEAALRGGNSDAALTLYAAGPLLPAFYEDWVLAERDRLDEVRATIRSRGGVATVVVPVTIVAHPRPPVRRDTRERLPLYLTRFIGRDTEIEALNVLWNDATNRLLTITGPGGVGKTRLFVHAASVVSPQSHAIRHVSLANAFDNAAVIRAVAATLGLDPAKADSDAVVIALDALGATHLLLDNLEQLVDGGVADLLTAWLGACPALQIVATSRQRLNVPGECDFDLSPLQTPTLPATPERLLDFDAVRLFLDRARLARSDAALTPRNADVVGTLCDRLGGLPLALELTAAWAGALTFRQILTRVETHLLDESGPPNAHRRAARPERHRTLRAALETSLELLTPSLREAFVGLSVFRGGFSVEAARSVLGDETGAVEMLSRLRERSLLVAETDEEADTLRFRFLPAIYAFARERFDAEKDRFETLNRAHRDHFLAVAETPRINEKQLDADVENVRAAFDFSFTQDGEFDLRLCVGLLKFWETRGYGREGWERTEQALARHPDAAPALRRQAHDAAGRLAYSLCEYAASQAHHESALALAEASNDTLATGKALQSIASCVLYRETDLPRAAELCDLARRMFRAAGDAGAEARLLLGRAVIAQMAGDYPSALAFQSESLALVPDTPEHRSTRASAHQGLGGTLTHLQRLTEAEVHLQTALELFREMGDRYKAANILLELGNLAYEQDEKERTAALYEEALPIFREHGELWATAVGLSNLGRLYTDTGVFARAGSLFTESLNLRVRLGDKHAQLQSLDAVVNLLVALATRDGLRFGRIYAREAVLLRAAENRHRAALGLGRANPDDALRAKEETFAERLGTAEHDRTVSEGDTLSFESAIAAARDALAKIR